MPPSLSHSPAEAGQNPPVDPTTAPSLSVTADTSTAATITTTTTAGVASATQGDNFSGNTTNRSEKSGRKESKTLRSQIPSFVPTSQVVKLQSTMNRLKGLFNSNADPSMTASSGEDREGKFTTAKTATTLFTPTNPEVDGEECLHDCDSCTVSLPRKWDIDESDHLYGHVNGWDYHMIVGTGKSDWVRDVVDEKGSLMEGVGIHGLELKPKIHTNGDASGEDSVVENGGGGSSKRRKVMLSASDMPTGRDDDGEVDSQGKSPYADNGRTSVILLPSWKLVEGVSKNEVAWLMDDMVAGGPSNVDKLDTSTTTTLTSIPTGVTVNFLQHQALILMCSHKTRDARCGQSAPLLRRELERHLRPLGLYRDLHDKRPGGVGIYFINHVGGHKYSANVMVYRRQGSNIDTANNGNNNNNTRTTTLHPEAVQGIWLARVRPEDCENIVKYTVLQGKVVKPSRQLRGGFDRSNRLTSW